MSPKAMMLTGACIMGGYLLVVMWANQVGVVRTTATIMYLEYRYGIIMGIHYIDVITWSQYVGVGLLGIGWVRTWRIFKRFFGQA